MVRSHNPITSFELESKPVMVREVVFHESRTIEVYGVILEDGTTVEVSPPSGQVIAADPNAISGEMVGYDLNDGLSMAYLETLRELNYTKVGVNDIGQSIEYLTNKGVEERDFCNDIAISYLLSIGYASPTDTDRTGENIEGSLQTVMMIAALRSRQVADEFMTTFDSSLDRGISDVIKGV